MKIRYTFYCYNENYNSPVMAPKIKDSINVIVVAECENRAREKAISIAHRDICELCEIEEIEE